LVNVGIIVKKSVSTPSTAFQNSSPTIQLKLAATLPSSSLPPLNEPQTQTQDVVLRNVILYPNRFSLL
jgi:hypothetical protein